MIHHISILLLHATSLQWTSKSGSDIGRTEPEFSDTFLTLH